MATTNYTAQYGTLQVAVPNGGTITVPYPAGTTQATFANGQYTGLGTVITAKNNTYRESAGQVSFAFGAGNITITNNSGVPWSVGDTFDYGFGAANFNYNFTGKTTPAAAVTDTASIIAALKTAGIVV